MKLFFVKVLSLGGVIILHYLRTFEVAFEGTKSEFIASIERIMHSLTAL